MEEQINPSKLTNHL